ncbi:WD40 repeat-like protein [Saitoella complicata NRRL Y-17804]|nr:WD40 repeat-like protein [Saitoella complicata NRRL Y-17804]ODQ55322.1 WD40 repeat-like protein [Saitoella complicata NRRL Y-17804]
MRISEDEGWDGEVKGPPAQPLSTVLPVDGLDLPRPQPWKLCTLHINALNFCQFAALPIHPPTSSTLDEDKDQPQPQLMIATPAVQDSDGIDINTLPTCTRLHTNVTPTLSSNEKPGMVMAVALLAPTTLLAGYESGYTVVMKLTANGTWETVYDSKVHSQPVLSLGVHPSREWFVTTAADAMIAFHPLFPSSSPSTGSPTSEPAVYNTTHSGLQALDIRDDGEIFATGGWDGKIRIWRRKGKEPKQLAVLKWHKESIYAVAFGRGGQGKNWVGVGSKDGKISLWEVY